MNEAPNTTTAETAPEMPQNMRALVVGHVVQELRWLVRYKPEAATAAGELKTAILERWPEARRRRPRKTAGAAA